jgi:hypothetical protein
MRGTSHPQMCFETPILPNQTTNETRGLLRKVKYETRNYVRPSILFRARVQTASCVWCAAALKQIKLFILLFLCRVCVSRPVSCPGQNKRIAPLSFFHRGKATKGLTSSPPEIECNQTMGLPHVCSMMT